MSGLSNSTLAENRLITINQGEGLSSIFIPQSLRHPLHGASGRKQLVIDWAIDIVGIAIALLPTTSFGSFSYKLPLMVTVRRVLNILQTSQFYS